MHFNYAHKIDFLHLKIEGHFPWDFVCSVFLLWAAPLQGMGRVLALEAGSVKVRVSNSFEAFRRTSALGGQ